MTEEKSPQEKALEFAEEYEKAKGRKPTCVPLGGGHDIESSGRKIEVKGRSGDWRNIVLEAQSYKKMKKTSRYYLYVVTNLSSEDREDWRLYILNKSAVEKHGVPWTDPRLAVNPSKDEREKYRVLYPLSMWFTQGDE
ncbi:MAG: DUF3883 domain-containing protein [Methanomassiliicoccales archaeon]|nr:MAG: DUF3883 domain-containing protein [Methanomassiliicoccales archaeon]